MLKMVSIKSQILVKTGLRIGASKENIHIGGIDTAVIRDPLTNEPYIPGSSVKGKMRFLLEWRLNKVDFDKGEPHQCNDPNCKICTLLGTTGASVKDEVYPTRLIMRDSLLSMESRKLGVITEEKTENAINRIEGKAIHPRTMERVVPGVRFDFECVLRVFDGDDYKDLLNTVLTGLYLLQQDYLGASGSRGYGKIAFVAKDDSGEEKEGYVRVATLKDLKEGKIELEPLNDYLGDE